MERTRKKGISISAKKKADKRAEFEKSVGNGLKCEITGRRIDVPRGEYVYNKVTGETKMIPYEWPEVRYGDVYSVNKGSHIVMCARSQARGVYDIMNSQFDSSPTLIILDPPYDMADGKSRTAGDRRTKARVMVTNETMKACRPLIKGIKRISQVNPVMYVFVSYMNMPVAWDVVHRLNFYPSTSIAIIRKKAMSGRRADFNGRFDLAMYCWKERRNRHFFSKEASNVENVWAAESRKSLAFKSTAQRDVIETMVDLSSRVAELVADPMAGSLTTMLACMNCGRKSFCVEKEPLRVAHGLSIAISEGADVELVSTRGGWKKLIG